MPIRTAIIPVAGLGTRFLPATKAQPKEMLPLVDTPIIQYIVEEAVAAGIEQIVFVTAVGKRAIEDHFDRNFELEYRLAQRKKRVELDRVARVGRLAKFAFVRQAKPMGDGDAVRTALPFVDAHEAVAVLFGDGIVVGRRPGIAECMRTHEQEGGSVLAVVPVPRREVHRYGVIAGRRIRPGVHRVSAFVEKPSPAHAPSRLAWIGWSILTPATLAFLRTARPGKGGELRLADAFAASLAAGEPLFARELSGIWYDCGTPLGFLQANVALGLRSKEYRVPFRKFLRKTIR